MLLLILQGSFSGVWIVFVGWFLLQAAGAEVRYTLAQQALAGLRVRDVMTPDPVTADPDRTLGQLMEEIVRHHRHHTYPVVKHGRPVGLLPFRCVAEVPRTQWDERRVRDCMIGLDQVPTLNDDQPAVDALTELGSGPTGRALVVASDRLVGLVSIRDIHRMLKPPPRRPGNQSTRSRPLVLPPAPR